LGSVTTKLLNDLDCPVMTGVHLERVQARSVHPFRRIGWLATLQPGDNKVLAWARDFAAAYGAELHVLYALPCLHTVGASSYIPDDLPPKMTEHARERIEALLKEAGVEAGIVARAGAPEGALRELVKAEQVDLIVTSRQAREVTVGLFGPHAAVSETVRLSPRPVISV
jgi:nucleotide-binding universal stress UspA family protein